jgi:hypothetical protein
VIGCLLLLVQSDCRVSIACVLMTNLLCFTTKIRVVYFQNTYNDMEGLPSETM